MDSSIYWYPQIETSKEPTNPRYVCTALDWKETGSITCAKGGYYDK